MTRGTIDEWAGRFWVFDLTADRPGAIVMKFSSFEVSEERYGWDAPEAGRMWLIEHPERGLLMINGQAFAETEAMSPVVNERAEAIVASMTFGS